MGDDLLPLLLGLGVLAAAGIVLMRTRGAGPPRSAPRRKPARSGDDATPMIVTGASAGDGKAGKHHSADPDGKTGGDQGADGGSDGGGDGGGGGGD